MTAIVKGEAEIPDYLGNFTERGFTDNPVYLTRFILTDADLMNLDAALIDDAECIKTAALCDEILQDDTNAELVVMSTNDAASRLTGQGILTAIIRAVYIILLMFTMGLTRLPPMILIQPH